MTDTLSARFGEVTISIQTRDVVRRMALQALSADEAVPAALIIRPSVGEYWAAQGGIYCGRLIDEQDRAYALIVARRVDGELEKVTWDAAGSKCGSLTVGSFTDWSLPNRMEALAMFQRLQPAVKDTDDAFSTDYVYWTSAQRASDSYYAWCQHFGYGGQLYYSKDYYGRARAVRRVVLTD